MADEKDGKQGATAAVVEAILSAAGMVADDDPDLRVKISPSVYVGVPKVMLCHHSSVLKSVVEGNAETSVLPLDKKCPVETPEALAVMLLAVFPQVQHVLKKVVADVIELDPLLTIRLHYMCRKYKMTYLQSILPPIDLSGIRPEGIAHAVALDMFNDDKATNSTLFQHIHRMKTDELNRFELEISRTPKGRIFASILEAGRTCAEHLQLPFSDGQRVMCKFRNGRYYSATVTAANTLYDVTFEDGDKRKGVTPDDMLTTRAYVDLGTTAEEKIKRLEVAEKDLHRRLETVTEREKTVAERTEKKPLIVLEKRTTAAPDDSNKQASKCCRSCIGM